MKSKLDIRKKFSELFRKKVNVSEAKKQEYQPSEGEIKRVKETYTFSSIFPTEEIMKRAMDIAHNKTNSEDEIER